MGEPRPKQARELDYYVLRPIEGTCALLVTLAGLAVVTGWHAQPERLIQFYAPYAPMPYTVALAFLLLGASLLLILYGKRGYSLPPLLLLLTFSTLDILGYAPILPQVESPADYANAVRDPPSHLSAYCFLILSFALLLGALRRFVPGTSSWLGIPSSIVIGTLIVPIIGGILSGSSTIASDEMLYLPTHTATGLLLAALGTFSLSLSVSGPLAEARWLSAAVGVGVLVSGIALWGALVKEQERQLAQQVTYRRDELRTLLSTGISRRSAALNHLGDLWQHSADVSEQRWRSNAQAYIDILPGFRAIAFVNADYQIRWIQPTEGNEAAVGLDLGTSPIRLHALMAATRTGGAAATQAITLAQGGEGFLLILPLKTSASDGGYISAAFEINAFFDALTASFQDDFAIAVFQDQRRIYGEGILDSGAVFPLGLPVNKWQIQLMPRPDHFLGATSRLPLVVLVCSLVLAVLLATAVFLAQNSRKHLSQAQLAYGQLSEADIYHHCILEALPIGVVTLDENNQILSANAEVLRLFGFELAELLGQDIGQLFPANTRQGHLKELNRYLEEPETHVITPNQTIHVRKKEGTLVPVEVSVTSLTLHGDTTILATVFDVTERLASQRQLRNEVGQRKRAENDLSLLNEELELRVKARTRELEDANRELDQFTYIASHDLQEPLRKQQMFTTILDEEVGDDINEDAKLAMRAINSGAARMQELVRSLLELSRARNQEMQLSLLSLDNVIRDVLNGLSLRIEETAAKVSAEPLPEIYCDSILITQVFQNLLTNAMRFTTKGTSPVISVYHTVLDDQIQITVEDNGIGIALEPQYAIFSPFKRLHARADYPGTGIGLSICKKIIERHGGSIWVESELGEGSRFHFTLSKQVRSIKDD